MEQRNTSYETKNDYEFSSVEVIGEAFEQHKYTYLAMLCKPKDVNLIARGLFSASIAKGSERVYPLLVLDGGLDSKDFFKKILEVSFGRGLIISRKDSIGKQRGLVDVAKFVGPGSKFIVFDPDDILLEVPEYYGFGVQLSCLYIIHKEDSMEIHRILEPSPASARYYSTDFVIKNEKTIACMDRNVDDYIALHSEKENILGYNFSLCSIHMLDINRGEHHCKSSNSRGLVDLDRDRVHRMYYGNTHYYQDIKLKNSGKLAQ